MHKHFKKIILISTLFFILLTIIPGSFANENMTNLSNCEADVASLGSGERIDIYFDASATIDGNGSKESPYKTLDSSRLVNNSNIYLEEGEYDAYLDTHILENCSFYGKNAEKTIITSSFLNNKPNIIANGDFSISDVTFTNTHFEARNDFTATNTIFTALYINTGDEDEYNYYYSEGFIRGLEDNPAFMNINNCTFYNCVGNSGAAIYLYRGNLNIRNSKFKDNLALDGGAIWMYDVTSTIIDSTFEENVAYYEGGCVYCSMSDVTFINSTFLNNRAKTGGAIHSDAADLAIVNCTFEKNNATSAGGAISTFSTDVTIIDSNFIGNKGNSCGGSIYLYALSYAEINNSNIEGGSCSGIGAGIFLGDSQLELNNVNIEDCDANYGSALTVLSGTSSLNNVTFKKNTAKFSGGAIYNVLGALSADNCQFMDNYAENGGAIYLNTVEIVNFNSNTFRNNAANNGSDVYLVLVNDTGIDLSSIDVCSNDHFEVFIGDGNYTMMEGNGTFNGTIPSRYNSAQQGYITPVKNQGDGGYCWAFTAMSVLESCVEKATGIPYVFSENNMINLNKRFSDYGIITNEEAGTTFNALGYLLSWLGPINGTLDPYDDHSKVSPIFDSLMHVQNVLFLDINTTTDNFNQNIKEAIMRYGAVGTALYWDNDYCNGSNYYFDGGYYERENHALTLVGWDDNYSRYNFLNPPPADGAWIAKNSWGNLSGDNGYYYISYSSQNMHHKDLINYGERSMDRLFTFILNDTIRFDKNYQFDFAGPTAFLLVSNGAVIKNVFNATGDEYLAAVSTYFMQDTQYEMNIYLNDELVLNQSSITKQGYYTINLDKIIPLKANDTFAVAFKMNNLNGNEFEALICEASKVTRNITFKKGISFIDDRDIYENKNISALLCIKAFTILNEINTSLDLSIDYDYDIQNRVNLTANVLDEYGRKPTYGVVTFNLEGNYYSVNVTDGVAKITHVFSGAISTVTATFNADGFNQSSDSAEIDVSKERINLDLAVSTYANTAEVNISSSKNINETVQILVNDDRIYFLNLTNGKNSLYLDDLPNGNNLVSLSIFNSTTVMGNANQTFVIDAVKSIIVSSNFSTFENSKELYSIRLVDENSNPISGKTVSFLLNDTTVEKITDGNGEAVVAIDLAEGKYNITTVFEGNRKIIRANATNVIEVKKLVSASVNVSKKQNTITIDIDLSKNINTTFDIEVNHVIYPVNATNGKARLVLDNLENGDYDIVVRLDDEEYIIKQYEESVNISLIKTSIISDDVVTVDDNKDVFSIQLVDEKNNRLSGKAIIFNVNGTDVNAFTDGNGKASVPLNLTGKYKIITTFEGDDTYLSLNKSNNVWVKTNLTGEIGVEQVALRSVEVSLSLSKDVDVDFILSINGKNQTFNSKEVLKLNDLANGEYKFVVYLNNDDYIFKCNQFIYIINLIDTRLVADDVVEYEDNPAKYSVKLVDNNNQPIPNKAIRYFLNNKVYNENTDGNGILSIPIDLGPGNYSIKVYFGGFEDYLPSNTTNHITIIKTFYLPSVTVYTNNSAYSVQLYDMKGNPLAETPVYFVVDGKSNRITTDKNGILTYKVYLNNGAHSIKVTNPATGQAKSQNINVVARLVSSGNIKMFYGGGNYYTVRVFDDHGNPAKQIKVYITVGSASYKVWTDSNGYAKLKITQKPGKYTMSVNYNGYKVSNKLTVFTTIVTKDISVKKGKTIQFSAKILNGKGKIVKFKKVSFKFKGKTYKIKTNKKGIATLKLSSKNFKKGKYAIKTIYGSLAVSNKIKIR